MVRLCIVTSICIVFSPSKNAMVRRGDVMFILTSDPKSRKHIRFRLMFFPILLEYYFKQLASPVTW